MRAFQTFFATEGLSWSYLISVCTDVAPSMLGSKSRFNGLVLQKAPDVTFVHCILHRHALASKTLPSELLEGLQVFINTVNFIKNRSLNQRLFKFLCADL